MEPAPTTPPVAQDEERAKEEQVRRAEQRRILREEQKEKALQELEVRHQEERRALSQELRDLGDGCKAIQDHLLADWISSSSPDLGPGRLNLTPEQQLKLSAEDGAPCSSVAPNGKEGPGEGGVRQQLKKEKQAQLKEFLPAKNELHVEAQRLLEVLDEEEFRKAYEHRIKVEDPREIEAYQRAEAAGRAGLWRFVSKTKVEAKRRLVEGEASAEADIAYVDNKRLGRPKLPVCYEEIKKLLDIEKNPIFSATLKEWNRKEELYNSRVQCRKILVASLKNEVYQLIGFFSVFQGVVLTAVSQSSFLYCHNKWSPIALSVLASVISTLAVIQKLNQINDLQGKIDVEDRDYKTAVQVGKLLRGPLPKGIDFSQLNSEINRKANRKSNWWTKRSLSWLYFLTVTLTLVAFGVLFPVSFWSILCKPGSPPVR